MLAHRVTQQPPMSRGGGDLAQVRLGPWALRKIVESMPSWRGLGGHEPRKIGLRAAQASPPSAVALSLAER